MSGIFNSAAFGDLDDWRARLNALLAGQDGMTVSVQASDLRSSFNVLFDKINELDAQAQELYECGLLLQKRAKSQDERIAALEEKLAHREV